VRRSVRILVAVFEILILSALILLPRCANYQDVFVAGNIYFSDADCYARMTRARICAEHPGTIVRHHDFENFPQGTTPHTTAPLDYLIVLLSILMKPITTQPLDLAGAIISPLLALFGGCFLWWWSRRMNLPRRWILLILYSISPILVHGTELGRPDHQSLLIVLIAIAICSEWTLQTDRSRSWSIVNGTAWALALWVSFYEPLILLALVLFFGLTKDRHLLFGRDRRIGWIVFAVVIAIAFLIEQRVPSLSIFESDKYFQNWSRTIGELAPVALSDRIWFTWAGYLIVIAPILIWLSIRNKSAPPFFVLLLLLATFLLTIWQARWSYFFVLIFAIALPGLLTNIKSPIAVSIAFMLSILPILWFWDAQLWPNESALARQIERRTESIQLRELALSIRSPRAQPFIAPWWLSPAISYWSNQPGVAGSSHEALDGITDSARFFMADDPQRALELARRHRVEWVFAYNWERLGKNSADLLGLPVSDRAIGRILDRSPSQAPGFFVLAGQNGAGKLFRFTDKL
jgi:hypothetical protein